MMVSDRGLRKKRIKHNQNETSICENGFCRPSDTFDWIRTAFYLMVRLTETLQP